MANAQLKYRYTENERGKPSLVYEDFRFQVKSRRDDRIYWRCSVRSCPARIATLHMIPTEPNPLHNHPTDAIQIRIMETMNEIKKRCREETKPIPLVYTEETSKLRTPAWDSTTQEMVKRLPTYQSSYSILYRQRAKLLPKLPANLRELTLHGDWTTNTAGEPFLLVDDGTDKRILIFATQANLKYLADATTIFGDGTFYTCPDLFTQIYSIHAEVAGEMYHLVYALLPGKTQAIYTRLFQLLRSTCLSNNIVLRPQTMFLDFEIAAHNAARATFPGIQIRGCFFHYTQCIWKKAQSTGLQTPYQTDPDITSVVRRAAVLPLVPPSDVDDVWFHALDQLGHSSTSTDATEFTDYVTTHWVEGMDYDRWNHYHTDGPRTTNHLEGWHAKIKRQVQHSHPNIYVHITQLKQIQAANEVSILQLSAGGIPRPKRRKYRDLECRLNSD
ncbi:hypothetical protein FSP39_017917 [Pinctada imbricata]|uniref:MULE transposase domain-containing protein n=1 Tax=Pinctada imbricata TaxID=66713 RepID=A0AA89BT58_PINIB|nr:hypothetical protein FSP39_017917 [Pinctada imbricata]